MKLALVKPGYPALHRSAVPVGNVSEWIRSLIKDMFETMEINNGVGLAAPQVGIPLRVFVIDVNGNRFSGVNPEIMKSSGALQSEEGCLSFVTFTTEVTRATEIVVRYRNAQGAKKRVRVNGLIARVFQHEIDHLNGVTLLDRFEETQGSDLVVVHEEKTVPDNPERVTATA